MFRLADILWIACVTHRVVILLFLLYVSQKFGYFCRLHQYNGNPSPGIPGFRPFSKNYPELLSPIQISQTSSKADCEGLVLGALIQSSSLHLTDKYTTDMMCLGISNFMFLRLCSLFIADSEM